jgi:polyferredoxin
MKILTKQYIIFFLIVLVVSPIIGLGLLREEFNPTFAARALFTATLSTVLYFMFNRSMARQDNRRK